MLHGRIIPPFFRSLKQPLLVFPGSPLSPDALDSGADIRANPFPVVGKYRYRPVGGREFCRRLPARRPFVPRQTLQTPFGSRAPTCGFRARVFQPRPGVRRCCDRDHRNAVYRAGRQTQVAAGALVGDHRVHQLACAEYRVHRADIDALAAADTDGFLDDGAATRPVPADMWSERFGRDVQQSGQRLDRYLVARRAPVDIGLAAGHGFGVRAAAGVAAQRALRLRQQCIDLFYHEVNSALFEHDRKVWPRSAIEATAELLRESTRCDGDIPLSGGGGTGTMIAARRPRGATRGCAEWTQTGGRRR